jgi:signal peptidase I
MEIKNLREKKSLKLVYEEFVDEKLRNIFHWIFMIAVTLGAAALTAIVFFQSVTVQESSMEPTLAVGEQFFMNRLIYRVSSPKRGDIIVFRTNASDEAALHVRRVIGLPGETIQIVNGNILINGEVYRESGDYPSITNSGIAANSITLGSSEYFVLGDNRNNSEDSRYADIGNVNKKYIVGKLWFTISPLSKIGFLKG